MNNFPVKGDDFTMDTYLKVSRIKNELIDCNDTDLNLVFENGVHRLHFTSQGCHSKSECSFGENIFYGKYDDLSAFAKDLTKWSKISLRVKNKHAVVLFNNKVIYNSHYKNPVGMLKGIDFTSSLFFDMDYICFYDSNNKLTYNEDFTTSIDLVQGAGK